MIINNNTTRKNRRQSAERGWEKRGGFAALALDSARGLSGCEYVPVCVRL